MIEVHLRIRGRVQRVHYRRSTQERALELKMDGWVRNRTDGSVEVVAQGSTEAVEALVGWCQEGPVMARVDDVEVIVQMATSLPEGFHVLPSD